MSQIILSLLANGALADGVAQNQVKATATDGTGAALVGQTVTLSVDAGGTISPVTATTDANGEVSAAVVSTTAGALAVTAALEDGTKDSISVTFAATQQAATQEAPAATTESPLAAMKASFAAKLQFIESGLAALGVKAEAELVELAEKYL